MSYSLPSGLTLKMIQISRVLMRFVICAPRVSVVP